jgi:CHAT domain-containing protein/Tfp pilus assembly protein PilF
LAEPLHLQSLEIRKSIFGEKSSEYLISLNNLANCYLFQGKYNYAEPLFLNVLNIRKENLGENNLDYALSLNNLAVLYVNQGKYSQAEPLYKKALEIRKEVLGQKHPDYATSLNNLANLFDKQGKYSKAEPLYKEALEIRKEVLGKKHSDYADSLNNLAGLYQEQGKYLQAEPLYKQALEIRKEVLGEKHPDYATSLELLGGLYRDQKKYYEAEPYALKALQIKKESLGEKHPDYLISLFDLGLLYELQDKHIQSEPLFLKTLTLRKEILGDNHPDYISNLFVLAHLYRIMELNYKSSIYYELFINANKKRILEDIYGLSEKELMNFVDFNKSMLFSPISFLKDFPSIYPTINTSCFESELLIKNLALRNQQLIKKVIQNNTNKILLNKYQQYIFNKRQISKIQELPLDLRPANLSKIKTETEILEIDLMKESIQFSEYKKIISLNFNNLKEELKNDEAIVYSVSFNYYKKSTDYAVFIIKRDFKAPKFIPLFEEKQLEFLLARNKSQQDSTRIDKQYQDKAISDLFFKPLEKELKDISTVYLSASGLGHQIDFAALPINNNQTLGEKYKLHVLNVPTELIGYKEFRLEKNNKPELLLYGGINYGKSGAKEKLENSVANLSEDFLNNKNRSFIKGFDYLEGTNKEVNQIKQKATENGFITTLLNESVATEESIKALDGRTTPYVLHLATHGFFFADSQQKELSKNIMDFEGKAKVYKTADDPMMRSGLVFAGVNNFWSKTNENNSIEDGILTASEISNLDLSACQLVVLSACETGLGEVKGSEGVFGLQRAFKMAGVKNIIMSLWKVPDAQTAELFDVFYSECFAGKTIHEAFQSAQSQMKAKYSPYYWAGFVLLE